MSDLTGKVVTYVDPDGVAHDALVVAEWGGMAKEAGGKPGVNLVYVSSNEKEDDRYGRQINREATSVEHKERASAPGRYWIEK